MDIVFVYIVDTAPVTSDSISSAVIISQSSTSDTQSRTQYILHPPLPVVSSSAPAEQLSVIPLLLNPDILQSSAIPVISPQV